MICCVLCLLCLCFVVQSEMSSRLRPSRSVLCDCCPFLWPCGCLCGAVVLFVDDDDDDGPMPTNSSRDNMMSHPCVVGEKNIMAGTPCQSHRRRSVRCHRKRRSVSALYICMPAYVCVPFHHHRRHVPQQEGEGIYSLRTTSKLHSSRGCCARVVVGSTTMMYGWMGDMGMMMMTMMT